MCVLTVLTRTHLEVSFYHFRNTTACLCTMSTLVPVILCVVAFTSFSVLKTAVDRISVSHLWFFVPREEAWPPAHGRMLSDFHYVLSLFRHKCSFVQLFLHLTEK